MKILFILFILALTTGAGASAYLGGSYGYSTYSSEKVKELKLSQKGPSYGAFLGIGRDFVGLEGFYQNFTTGGKIKHDGGKHDYTTDATAMGAALRFSFAAFYARLGFGRYKLKQKIDIEDESSLNAANQIYDVQDDVSKNGVLYGVGAHKRFKSFVTFIDVTRHQITGAGNYDVISVGISFNLPERLFGVVKI